MYWCIHETQNGPLEAQMGLVKAQMGPWKALMGLWEAQRGPWDAEPWKVQTGPWKADRALVVLKGNLGGSSEVLEGLDGASGGSQGHLGPELALSILLSAMDVKLDSTYYMQDTKTLLNEESSLI